jgi:hypothetical protein
MPGAPLLLYISTSHSAVGVALVQEKLEDGVKEQMPVYFISEVLGPSKKNYLEMKKVLYAMLMDFRKLHHYFQSYNIIVPSSQQLKDIIRNREATNRIGKWATKLNKFVNDFIHRSSIESQALAYFIVGWTPRCQDEASVSDEAMWTIFYDGSWGSFGAGATTILISPSKMKTSYAAKLEFQCTNNITQYEAILLSLWKLKAMGVKTIVLKSDS